MCVCCFAAFLERINGRQLRQRSNRTKFKWNAQHQPSFVFRFLFLLFHIFAFNFFHILFVVEKSQKRNLSSSLLFSCCCCCCCFYYIYIFIPIDYVVSWLCPEHHKRTMDWTIWKLKLKQQIFFLKNRRREEKKTWKKIWSSNSTMQKSQQKMLEIRTIWL